MKKLVSLIAAAAMFAAVSGATIAADNNPTVFVDGREIFFDDQAAVIKDDRTLVPARGVFEAMGAKVDWNEDKRQVQVTSSDEQTIVRLVIDDSDMKVYDMSGLFAALMTGQDFHAPETVVTLDVPAQIMNDRTMVPLRAISEAVDAQVDWNGEANCVEIITKNASEPAEDAPILSLSTSTDTVAEGEMVDVFVNVKNLPEDTFVSGLTSVIGYDNNNYEFVRSSLVNDDTELESDVEAVNDVFADNQIKIVYVTTDSENAAKNDGAVAKLTFKAKNSSESAFYLVNSYSTNIGYDTSLLATTSDVENTRENTFIGDKLAVDTTPVIVNAAE